MIATAERKSIRNPAISNLIPPRQSCLKGANSHDYVYFSIGSHIEPVVQTVPCTPPVIRLPLKYQVSNIADRNYKASKRETLRKSKARERKSWKSGAGVNWP
jgi:hypothetical protein